MSHNNYAYFNKCQTTISIRYYENFTISVCMKYEEDNTLLTEIIFPLLEFSQLVIFNKVLRFGTRPCFRFQVRKASNLLYPVDTAMLSQWEHNVPCLKMEA
jgi:hypothetical protein